MVLQDVLDVVHGPEILGKWTRNYQVDLLVPPLDNLKRVTVTVSWTYQGARSVTATTYLRR